MAALLSRPHPQIRAPPDDSGDPSTTEEGTGIHAQSGSLEHRLIGVAIVLALILLAFILWLVLAKRPRRKLRSWGCTCLPAPPERIDDGEYAGNRDGGNRSQSWVTSHDMETHQMYEVGSEPSSFQAKHISQWEVEPSNKIQKGNLQP
ncbi:uncharacterized protein C8R40DRAFT_1065661 [Lentinula edodes]|uniref:uncharacterized protein n=1 Tax=Lentinula edodes TaxID=5353 RepID=UPI001E8DF801|nr:uncharacterized protein C8R40DRAFT_1065661 [Lentinula edodes]KAH7880668.1 hypothetical protein C8R40DRAFT_1065661 [Lentinula edodes]KAJ3920651.1 hypothetical protein F5877DRAFT_76904 [Lentinula edodes]